MPGTLLHPTNAATTSRRRLIRVLAPLFVLALLGGASLGARQATMRSSASAQVVERAPQAQDRSQPTRDLSIDESMGGHTLMRHVGKTDADLRERLRREPQISSASTYTDRTTAERVVGAALASSGKLNAWVTRRGRRPNLVLHYAERSRPPLGRSLSRGPTTAAPCNRVIVVLRWDERRDRFYVLTSYPEVDR